MGSSSLERNSQPSGNRFCRIAAAEQSDNLHFADSKVFWRASKSLAPCVTQELLKGGLHWDSFVFFFRASCNLSVTCCYSMCCSPRLLHMFKRWRNKPLLLRHRAGSLRKKQVRIANPISLEGLDVWQIEKIYFFQVFFKYRQIGALAGTATDVEPQIRLSRRGATRLRRFPTEILGPDETATTC